MHLKHNPKTDVPHLTCKENNFPNFSGAKDTGCNEKDHLGLGVVLDGKES